jgi:hypothetical protein
MLQETQDISIGALNYPSEETGASCELVIAGQPSGHRVNGCVWEAAIKCENGYLVFLTDDIPFEDALNIHLISPSGLLWDTARLFGLYSTGTFRELTIEPPDTVAFRFFRDTVWRVQVLPKPTWRIPFFSEPLGAYRPFGFKRQFVVSVEPHPEQAQQSMADG